MNKDLFTQWHEEGLLSESSLKKLEDRKNNPLFSVYWEIKTLMYLAVLLLSGGLGILIYKNIDSIGHTAILIFLIALCTGSFFYCFKNNPPFSFNKTTSPIALFDYLLLLACLSLLTIIAYIQYQYTFFGNHFGLATFIPMIILFFSAYYFDNIGILSVAITNLAAWLGITVTPLDILKANDFNSTTIIFTGLFLGILLIVFALVTKHKDLKKHFEFTYANFGMHIFFISCIAAMFHFSPVYVLWFIILLAFSYYFYTRALRERSFYYLLIITLYSYVALSYVVINLISMIDKMDTTPLYLGFIYFIASGIGMVLFLINENKKFKTK